MSGKIVNPYGRPFEELDALKGMITLQSGVARGCNYSVYSEDGQPLFGSFRPDRGERLHVVALGWRVP